MTERLIVIATGQNWPNVFSALHYKARVEDVTIFATNSMSARAKALSAALTHLRFRVTIHDAGPSPFGAMAAFLDTHPDDETWILNATGGLKTFAYELTDYLEQPWLTVVYREYGEREWREVVRQDGRIGYKPAEDLSAAESQIRSLPIDTLIKIQLQVDSLEIKEREPNDANSPGKDGKWPEADKVELSALAKIVSDRGPTERPIEYKARYSLPGEISGGDPLEFLVRQTVDFVGLKPHWSVRAVIAGPTKLFESDVITTIDDRLVLFDVKNRSDLEDKGIVWQVQEAKERVEKLGGIGGHAVLIRPLIETTPEIKGYARSTNVEIWDQPEMVKVDSEMGFFGRIGKLSGTTNRDVLTALKALDEEVAAHATPFGTRVLPLPCIDWRDRIREALHAGKAVFIEHDDLERVYLPPAARGGSVWRGGEKLSSPQKYRKNLPRAIVLPGLVELRIPGKQKGEFEVPNWLTAERDEKGAPMWWATEIAAQANLGSDLEAGFERALRIDWRKNRNASGRHALE